MRIAIVPGSFDPMTLGHKDVVQRAVKMFDRVFVAIMINPNKKGKFSFADIMKRLLMAWKIGRRCKP